MGSVAVRLSSPARRVRQLGQRRWSVLTTLGLNNLRINRYLVPAATVVSDELTIEELDLSTYGLRAFLDAAHLTRYASLPYAHSKALEYYASIAVLGSGPPPSPVLDAAGGVGEFSYAIRHRFGAGVQIFCQDSRNAFGEHQDFTTIGGSIDSVPLPDGSVGTITCHHSFEHFRGDLDISFIRESLRLLRVGGSLVIVPLFVGSHAVEIWNSRGHTEPAPGFSTVFDPTATFAGWGPYEHFARVYDPATFASRVLSTIPARYRPRLVRVLLDGRDCPDLRANPHQPVINAQMRMLVVDRVA
jgi:SAM-dependent methyltransferase